MANVASPQHHSMYFPEAPYLAHDAFAGSFYPRSPIAPAPTAYHPHWAGQLAMAGGVQDGMSSMSLGGGGSGDRGSASANMGWGASHQQLQQQHHMLQHQHQQQQHQQQQQPLHFSRKAGSGAISPPRKSHPQSELSRTNIYISGLKADTTDEDLRLLCECFGEIISTKAIIDRDLSICKGYGFVMFEHEVSARAAIDALVRGGAQATYAKMTRAQLEHQRCEVDPTNLYFTNLHKDIDEAQLTAMLMHCLDVVGGDVVSCRVLRDEVGFSRGVGLARLDSREACEIVISRLNGFLLPGCVEPVRVKYANGPTRRGKQQGGRHAQFYPRDGAADGSPVLTPSISFSDLGALAFEDDLLVPDEMLAPPPHMPGHHATVAPVYSPRSQHGSMGSAPGSRLSAWVGSPKEEALHVPLSLRPPHPTDRAPPVQFELEFALDESARGVASLLEDL